MEFWKKLYTLLICLSFSAVIIAGANRKPTYAEKDIFQSANFLKNVPGLINDYHGQPVRYFADHDGVTVFFTDAGPIYKVVKIDTKAAKEMEREKEKEKKQNGEREEEERSVPTLISYTPMKWLGANPHPQIEEQQKNTGTYSFLDKSGGKLKTISTEGFKKIVYRDMYPGIDVEYSFPDKGGMKYNVILHPGADANLISMQYAGAAQKIQVDKKGNMTIHTETGDILEHTPVSYSADGKPVASSFHVAGTTIGFSLPSGYDHSQVLTIDPWVSVITQLTVLNLGTSVDYDVPGNLYVYGAGANDLLDTTNYQKVAKFDPTGIFRWVFMGSIPSQNWNTTGNAGFDALSNAKIDRVNGKVYVGQGLNTQGTQVIRLDSSGAYDNFISNQDSSFREVWSFTQNCYSGEIIAQGGGIGSNLNTTIINPSTGVVRTTNFTGNATIGQDIVSGALDPAENLYVVMASVTLGTPVNNKIYRVNAAYNGTLWGPIATGYTVFSEANNTLVFQSQGNAINTNNCNSLAANNSYLYYYDGKHIKAFNKTTGAAVGTAVNITGYTAKVQQGIAVDNCNNIYLGGKGSILTYNFNGTTFTAGTPISLGAGFTTDTVLDVRYDGLNNLLYVTGTRLVGTYVATPSISCVINVPFTDTITTVCAGAVVNVTPDTAGIANPVFSYRWQDSVGNILLQTTPSVLLTDTFRAPYSGRFTVQVQLNANCGGISVLDSFNVVLCNTLVHSPDTTICANQPVNLSATGSPAGGTYLWQPGGSSGSSITVSPSVSTVYAVTYTPLVGPPITDSIHVTVTSVVAVSVNDTSVCRGQAATLTATPTIPGGTYSWSPGSQITPGITVTPATTTTYTVTYTTLHCGTATASGTVTVGPFAGPDRFVTCFPSNTSTTMAATGTGTWTAQATNPAAVTIVSPASPTTSITGFSMAGVYSFIWTSASGCTDTALVTVTANPNAGPDQTLACAALPGGTVTMAAAGSGTWTAQAGNPGSATITAVTDPGTTITSFTVAGTYNFIWTSGTCSDTASVIVSVGPNAGPDQSISCIVVPGGSVTMAGTGTGTWTADAGNPGTASIANASSPSTTITAFSAAGVYTFIWSNGSCADTALVTVTAKPDAGNDATICPNNTATLDATGTGTWSALASNPAVTTINTPGNSSTTISGFTVSGTYGYVWTSGGCTDTANVIVNAPPVLSPLISNITCNRATGIIYANGTGVLPLTYQWNNTSTADSITTTSAGVLYSVTVTDFNGCTASASDSVHNAIVIVAVNGTSTNVSCYGYIDGQVALAVTPPGSYTYTWSPGGSGDTLTGLAPGSYSVSATDPNGCSATAGPFVITSPGLDSLSITPLDTTITLGDTIRLNSTVMGTYPAITYSWTPTDGLSCSNCPAPVLVPTDFDTVKRQYQLTITYNNGCTATATDSILAKPNDLSAIPTAFTPNGDNLNKTFKILATGVKDFRMNIYNRWGQQVFSTTDITVGWDGTYLGKDEPVEVYQFFYSITYHDGRVENKEGSFTLFR